MPSNLKLIMRHFVNLPFHPQWLVLRNEEKSQKKIANILKGRILDIGCGNRQIEKLLSKSDTDYIGLDYPTTHAKGYSGLPDIFGDGQCLPFKGNSFDSIILLDVLEHLPSPELCIQEIARVLRKKGKLVLKTPFLYPLHDMPYDFQRWTLPGLEQLVQYNNFSIVTRHIIGSPCETSSALISIALAKAALDSLKNKSPIIFLIPFFIIGIIISNLAGFLMAKILPADDFMPLGYCLICTKNQ